MAKTKPQTEQETTIQDWKAADETLKEIGSLSNEIDRLNADMNDAITKVQERFKSELDRLAEDKIMHERNLQLYCEKMRDEFDSAKTKKLSYGEVSFREGTGALKTMKGFTWKAVESLLKKSKKYKKYLVEKVSIDKDKIKKNLKAAEMAKLGMVIDKTENFYYEVYETENVVTPN